MRAFDYTIFRTLKKYLSYSFFVFCVFFLFWFQIFDPIKLYTCLEMKYDIRDIETVYGDIFYV